MTGRSVLLVGKGSQLAKGVLKAADGLLSMHGISHNEIVNSLDLTRYDVVINMAYDPSYMREEYEECRDVDLRVAKLAHRAGCHFVMLSTRRVYGPEAPFPVNEGFTPAPVDHYGSNKLRTEREVQKLMGVYCTILRVANVFDFECGRHTFFGIALKSLKETNRIVLDVSPFVKRDFIFIDDFAELAIRVLQAPKYGIFNLGSGQATEVGRIAIWLLEGYSRGEMLVNSYEHRDSFELDRSKLILSIGTVTPPLDIRQRCLEIGSRLRYE